MSTVYYSWQRVLLEAFMAPPDRLLERIEAAKDAIARRFEERPEADERLALCDALIDLNVLRSEATEFAACKTCRGGVNVL